MQEGIAKADTRFDKRREAEFSAFAAWIKASAADPRLRKLPQLSKGELAAPTSPDEVVRHARKDRVLDSFENTVWAFRFRCAGCHAEGSEENNKLRHEHGDQVAWMKRAGAAATMEHLLKNDLIDRDRPEQSLLLLKPLGEVEHAGGKKFLPGDLGYKAFRRWIEDYVKTVGGRYPSAASLPERGEQAYFGSDIWIKLADTPEAWGEKLLQVELYAWDAQREAWEKQPVAYTDRAVWGKGNLWQHNLTLVAERNSARAKKWSDDGAILAPGRYLVKAYVDQRGRLARDWKAILGESDFVGQTEIESQWPSGYGKMTAVNAGSLQK